MVTMLRMVTSVTAERQPPGLPVRVPVPMQMP
jgi:hypothetical protein